MTQTYLQHMQSILRVLVHIEKNLSEELCLEKLVRIAHISPHYFHRLFHAYMGETLHDYVTRLRIQHASEKLNHTNATVTEIAFEAGYETPSSFTKAFQQLIGESPRSFRKSMRQSIETMLARIPHDASEKSLLPQYIKRQDEEVLFVRTIGPYSKTPWEGFKHLLTWLQKKNISKEDIKAFYSMGLDDPHFFPASKCRFDACVVLKGKNIPEGDVGLKIIPGGKCAVFTHHGSYSEIETFFQKLLISWLPTANINFADTAPFCEHLDLGDAAVPMTERTTYLHIPLEA